MARYQKTAYWTSIEPNRLTVCTRIKSGAAGRLAGPTSGPQWPRPIRSGRAHHGSRRRGSRGQRPARPRRDHRRLLRLPSAGRLARGAGAGQGRPVPRSRLTGAARSRDYGDPGRGSCWWASPRPRTAPTARRVFTGDASGDFLWRALHAVGLADRPVSRRADDGLELFGARVTAAVRCAPPANKPTPEERATCRPYLVREIELLADLRVIVPLGAIGWDATLRSLAALGLTVPAPNPGSPTARNWSSARTRSSGATTRASRTRSRAA